MKLLPAGEARMEKMTDVTLENQGQKLHVTEFGITGLGFEPQTVWLDDDQHLFGFPGKWFAILREGWESTTIVSIRSSAPPKTLATLVWRRTSRSARSMRLRWSTSGSSIQNKPSCAKIRRS
jgi:hypothetical protein